MFLVEIVFDEVEVQSTWNIFNFYVKLEILPHFNGSLNIEKDCADVTTVCYEHIIVYLSCLHKCISFSCTSEIRGDFKSCVL